MPHGARACKRWDRTAQGDTTNRRPSRSFGSADICLVSTTPIDQVLAHLRLQRVDVEEGPVPRTGALGPMESVYIRDPDGNLIEIASYGAAAAGP